MEFYKHTITTIEGQILNVFIRRTHGDVQMAEILEL